MSSGLPFGPALASMKDIVQLFYTASFPEPLRSQLQSILLAASQYIEYELIYDPAFEGLSPSDLFKLRNCSFSRHNYALVADRRTLMELFNDETPSVLVVSVRPSTPQQEWEMYNGPGDLSLLHPYVRLALLRALAEERVTLDRHTEDWFWPDPKSREYTDILWQIKTVRADPAGAHHVLSVYAVKDVGDMHALYSEEAAKTGGVFHGL